MKAPVTGDWNTVGRRAEERAGKQPGRGALLRTAGRIGLLTYGLHGAADFAVLVARNDSGDLPGLDSWLTALALVALRAVTVVLALVAVWLSLGATVRAHTVVRGTLIAGLGGYMALDLVAYSPYGAVPEVLAGLWVLGAAVLLRPARTDAGEPDPEAGDGTRATWAWQVAVPLLTSSLLVARTEHSVLVYPSLMVGLVLAGALLYQRMRRRQPGTTPVGWAGPALVLVALMLPDYYWDIGLILLVPMPVPLVELVQRLTACVLVTGLVASLALAHTRQRADVAPPPAGPAAPRAAGEAPQ